VLIVQGTEGRIMPLMATGNRLAAVLANASLITIFRGPHAIIWTHAAEVNGALLGFLDAL
jgi:non-heme chloroperoxidase